MTLLSAMLPSVLKFFSLYYNFKFLCNGQWIKQSEDCTNKSCLNLYRLLLLLDCVIRPNRTTSGVNAAESEREKHPSCMKPTDTEHVLLSDSYLND